MELSTKDWRGFLKLLKGWYQADDRPLPWKGLDDAYLVWVSEVFLQQTQADRVVEYWLRFTAKFPTVEDLAAASFEEALPYFKGLGFYGRLRRMIATAQAVGQMSRAKGRESRVLFPKTIEELEALPGIGPYTARAIASFAYGQKVLAPDTNVIRVLARYFGIGMGVGEMKKRKAFQSKWVMQQLGTFDEWYPEKLNLNQALMDLGAKVCTARKPICETCPLIKKCEYGRDPRQFENLVVKSREPRVEGQKVQARSLRNYQKIVVGILIDGKNKRVLVSRRKKDQTFAGLLEFPGGKVEVGEDLRAAMQREFREEVGVEVSVRPAFEKMALHRQKLILHFHRCRILIHSDTNIRMDTNDTNVSFTGLEGQELMWIDQADLDPKQFLPANKEIIETLKKSRF